MRERQHWPGFGQAYPELGLCSLDLSHACGELDANRMCTPAFSVAVRGPRCRRRSDWLPEFGFLRCLALSFVSQRASRSGVAWEGLQDLRFQPREGWLHLPRVAAKREAGHQRAVCDPPSAGCVFGWEGAAPRSWRCRKIPRAPRSRLVSWRASHGQSQRASAVPRSVGPPEGASPTWGQIRPNIDQPWLDSTRFGSLFTPHLVYVGLCSTTDVGRFDKHWIGFGQIWAALGQIWIGFH